jgi:predicted  nucleic acid-binding Zn-ribbon protein
VEDLENRIEDLEDEVKTMEKENQIQAQRLVDIEEELSGVEDVEAFDEDGFDKLQSAIKQIKDIL